MFSPENRKDLVRIRVMLRLMLVKQRDYCEEGFYGLDFIGNGEFRALNRYLTDGWVCSDEIKL